ncbi:hypothetical protein WOLCODRAFT_26334 [Wolfiporia cocos MD-104 SS10]|uniref:DUF6533 domain-containing protein n=1 Tax=Wolfiporia cocos (strain MD-104) TaxID=742152 RepID=A0A2H3JP46_WOLCO|nr:hypothetical protein WOLCODRAFT_26334 [Wolfiporia cocos MD-104 SS10]
MRAPRRLMSTSDVNFVELTRIAHIMGYNSTAAVTWLLYDFARSLDDEITLIWRSADTLPKFLYFISRYLGLFVQLCSTFRILPLCCQKISLMLRVYAVYGKTRAVIVILCVSAFGEVLAFAIFNWLGYVSFFDDVKPYPADWPIKGCYYPRRPTIFNLCSMPILIFETVLFVLISVKCFAHRPLREIPILQRIWRDGTIYYLIITAAIAVVMVSSAVQNTIVAGMSIVWISAILSFSGSHLLLSIRALAEARNGAQMATPMLSEDIPNIVVESPSALASPIDGHNPFPFPIDA